MQVQKTRAPYRVTVRGLVGGREWIREPRTEKQSPGLFSPACGRSCCSHLTLSSHKPRTPCRETVRGLVGGREWIRTTEVVDGRFTVCSLWPLGNSPIFNFCVATKQPTVSVKGGAGGRTKPRYTRFSCSVTVASQQYRPRTSRRKTIRRIVFCSSLTLSGFESEPTVS